MKLTMVPVDRDFRDADILYSINDEAFPEAERIASSRLLGLFEKIGCETWAIYDVGMVGFTSLIINKATRIAYMWYLAIGREHRSRGYGTWTLHQLAAMYPDIQIVLDLERLDDSAENAFDRRRRIDFYERNGFRHTGCGMFCYGVDYEIMFCGAHPFRRDDFDDLLKNVPMPGFAPRLYSM